MQLFNPISKGNIAPLATTIAISMASRLVINLRRTSARNTMYVTPPSDAPALWSPSRSARGPTTDSSGVHHVPNHLGSVLDIGVEGIQDSEDWREGPSTIGLGEVGTRDKQRRTNGEDAIELRCLAGRTEHDAHNHLNT